MGPQFSLTFISFSYPVLFSVSNEGSGSESIFSIATSYCTKIPRSVEFFLYFAHFLLEFHYALCHHKSIICCVVVCLYFQLEFHYALCHHKSIFAVLDLAEIMVNLDT